MAKTGYALGDFILAEMKKRNLSEREFAKVVEVGHSTINRFLNYRQQDPGYPSTEFLLKLARATGVDLITVLAMAFPEAAEQTPISPQAQHLARRIDQAPDHVKEVIEAILTQYKL